MIAVLMMFKDEEDIIGKCIDHWSGLGVDEFFLCDNGSTDLSFGLAVETLKQCGKQAFHCAIAKEDFPQREAINYLKTKAIQFGHQWLFPIDADEFLNLGDVGYTCIRDFINARHHSLFPPHYVCQYQYKNIMPNGVSWVEPEHKKVFGKFKPEWNISIGNHQIENVNIFFEIESIWLDHYQYRSYDQFKRKKITFFKAFEKAGYLDHKFVKEYRLYQKHGEAYLEQMWDYLLRGVTEFEFKPHAQ